MSDTDTAAWYAIGSVARKTGLSVHTLRAWERRYRVVTPQRSPGGTRLYSNADVARLRLLRRAVDRGHAIGQIAELAVDKLRDLLREPDDVDPPGRQLPGQRPGDGSWLVQEILKAVEILDSSRIHALLMRAVVTLPVGRVLDEVILPVLREVGDRWAAGAICPANEHLLTVSVRRVLAWLTETVPVPLDAPTVIVTTPSGHWHELGSQIAGVVAAQTGWRVVYLGANLPAADIVRAVEITSAKRVLLGITLAEEEVLMSELAALGDGLPEGVDVIVGGRGVEPYERRVKEMGIRLVPTYQALRKAMELSVLPNGSVRQ
jgi:MerR family transcriptional regulator, light-induced transcriptional regulator